MINQISSNQLQQIPICSITTINQAINVTNSYWNINSDNQIGGIMAFGPLNSGFWNKVGLDWNQWQLGIKLNNMSDWTAFGVDPNQVISQNTSMFSVGSNLTFSESVNPTQSMLNINTTLVGVKNTFAVSKLGFGQIIYNSTLAGSQTPMNATIQQLFTASATPVLFTTAYRGLGLPATAWTFFSNLMEIVTKGSFDCTTDFADGVNYGTCIAFAPCSSFSNLWQQFAF